MTAQLERGPKPGARFAFLALLAGASGIGFAPILVRWSELGPVSTAFHRLLLAQPLLWLWLTLESRRQNPPPRPASRREHGLLALAGFLFAADMALWNWSVVLTSVANATLLANLTPVFVTLGAWLLFGERITARFLLGLVLGLAGATMLIGASVQISARHLLGDICGVVTAVFYGGYMLAIKGLRRRFSTATIMAWTGLSSAATLFLAAALSGERLWAQTAAGWAVLLALALCAQVLGQGLIAFAFAHLPASFSSLSLLFQPIVATALAWLLLHEQPTWFQALGGVVILCGIAVASRAGIKPRNAATRGQDHPL